MTGGEGLAALVKTRPEDGGAARRGDVRRHAPVAGMGTRQTARPPAADQRRTEDRDPGYMSRKIRKFRTDKFDT